MVALFSLEWKNWTKFSRQLYPQRKSLPALKQGYQPRVIRSYAARHGVAPRARPCGQRCGGAVLRPTRRATTAARPPRARAGGGRRGPARRGFDVLGDAVLTGHLDGEALARAVASADVFYHPRTTETFGNVVLEAMAAGLPIVAAETPGSRALLDNGIAGTLYSPEAIEAATAAMEELAASPK